MELLEKDLYGPVKEYLESLGYEEQALLVARILRESGPMQALDVRKAGGPSNTTSILGRNVLDWFSRELAAGGSRYLYRVTDKGLAALEEYKELL